jgi:metal-responsive CopG/Arc/MetJ family transcriptional regulator
METIQVVLDKKLLQATDRAARQTKRNRSALIRDALREHIRRLEIRALEERTEGATSTQRRAREESLTSEAVWSAE